MMRYLDGLPKPTVSQKIFGRAVKDCVLKKQGIIIGDDSVLLINHAVRRLNWYSSLNDLKCIRDLNWTWVVGIKKNRRVNRKEKFSISAEEAKKRRAAVRIAELEGKSVEEGEKDRQTLAEAAKTFNAPGIENLLRILGADEAKKG